MAWAPVPGTFPCQEFLLLHIERLWCVVTKVCSVFIGGQLHSCSNHLAGSSMKCDLLVTMLTSNSFLCMTMYLPSLPCMIKHGNAIFLSFQNRKKVEKIVTKLSKIRSQRVLQLWVSVQFLKHPAGL